MDTIISKIIPINVFLNININTNGIINIIIKNNCKNINKVSNIHFNRIPARKSSCKNWKNTHFHWNYCFYMQNASRVLPAETTLTVYCRPRLFDFEYVYIFKDRIMNFRIFLSFVSDNRIFP